MHARAILITEDNNRKSYLFIPIPKLREKKADRLFMDDYARTACICVDMQEFFFRRHWRRVRMTYLQFFFQMHIVDNDDSGLFLIRLFTCD